MSNAFAITLKGIPVLAINGSNWAVFKDSMQYATDPHGLWDHLTGDAQKSKPSPPNMSSPPTPDELKKEKAYKDELAMWNLKETAARSMLHHHIPRMYFKQVYTDGKPISEAWNKLKSKFERKDAST